MIISASRRTDIPAFYSPWMMHRLREGFCDVPNPFNIKKIRRVSLKPSDVEAIVFWTRYPAPMLSSLVDCIQMGHNILFLVTITGYPRFMELNRPPVQKSLDSVLRLAERIGHNRIMWRYDPIVMTQRFSADYHRLQFHKLASALSGSTNRVTVSFFQEYSKNRKRMREALQDDMGPIQLERHEEDSLLTDLACISQTFGMSFSICASGDRILPDGVLAGSCIDAGLIHKEFGTTVSSGKDSGQRKTCGCVPSCDIGMYDSCHFGCAYCYAVKNFSLAQKNRLLHDPTASSLLPLPIVPTATTQLKLPLK